jgi:hypothetical protein
MTSQGGGWVARGQKFFRCTIVKQTEGLKPKFDADVLTEPQAAQK